MNGELRDKLLRELAEHGWLGGIGHCRCGWEDPLPNWCGEDARYQAHLADALTARLNRTLDNA